MRGPKRINVVAPCLTLGKMRCARTQLVCTQQASRVKLGLCKAVTPRLTLCVGNQPTIYMFAAFRTSLFFP